MSSVHLLQGHVPQSLRSELDSDVASSSSPAVTKKHRILTYAELPPWMKENKFILTGYRGDLNSWTECLRSIFGYLHNETVNIHTHLHGSILFCFFLGTFGNFYLKDYEDVSWIDHAVFIVFLSSAVFCLLCSALYHTSLSHSEQVADRCKSLDYSGIIALILGSFYPCMYYGFYCHQHITVAYMLLIHPASLAAAYVVFNPEYAKPIHRRARARVFMALGLSGILPISHMLLSYGTHQVLREMGFIWLLMGGVMYVTGGLIYTNRVPERWAPGRFDYFFSSHQIFHVFVLLAALSTYVCVVKAAGYWHGPSGICVA